MGQEEREAEGNWTLRLGSGTTRSQEEMVSGLFKHKCPHSCAFLDLWPFC